MATVTRRGKSYSIRVSCGYDMTGRQIIRKPQPDMTDAQAEKEAQRQAVLFEEKCRTGQVLQGNVRFADFAEIWLRDYAAKQVRPTTFDRYKAMLPRINAAIGHIRLDRLQPHHLMQFYSNLEEAGIREDGKQHFKGDLWQMLRARSITKTAFAEQTGVSLAVLASITQGKNVSAESARRISDALGEPVSALFEPVGNDKGLSAKTILHHHRLISVILQTAVEWQVLFSNPCDRVKPPRVEHKEARYLDEEQAARLMEALESADIQNRTMIKLLLYTGMRRGELCGLTWEDIDFDHCTVHVDKSLLIVNKGYHLTTTKEDNVRDIDVAPEFMEYLKTYRDQWLAQKHRMGSAWQTCMDGKWESYRESLQKLRGKNFIVINDFGWPISPDHYGKIVDRVAEKAGIRKIHPHMFRHTFVSILLSNPDIGVATVAAEAGHAQPSTTLAIYTQVYHKRQDSIRSQMSETLYKRKTPER